MKDMKKDKKHKESMKPEHEAKRNVLQHLSDSMRRHMGENIKSHMDEPMKKVSVEAPDAEGLKKGLDLASELAPEMDKLSDVANRVMEEGSEEERDMDEVAMEAEEESNEKPEDHAVLLAEHLNEDESNVSEMEKIRKALSKKA